MWLDTVFTITALLGGTVLAFQFVLMLMGLGDSDMSGADGADMSGGELAGGDHFGGHHVGGVDAGGVHAGGVEGASDHPTWQEAADADLGHPQAPWFYEVLSLRTLSAGITFFGLAGKAAMAYGEAPMQAFVIASLAGVAALYAVYWLFKQLYKVQHSGNENVRNAIGLPATVYIPIPANRAGAGKVTFRLQNRLVEYQAVTEAAERLKTGEKVVIVAVVNSDTVRVAAAEKRIIDAPAPNTNVGSSV